jgi:hypothetical protein
VDLGGLLRDLSRLGNRDLKVAQSTITGILCEREGPVSQAGGFAPTRGSQVWQSSRKTWEKPQEVPSASRKFGNPLPSEASTAKTQSIREKRGPNAPAKFSEIVEIARPLDKNKKKGENKSKATGDQSEDNIEVDESPDTDAKVKQGRVQGIDLSKSKLDPADKALYLEKSRAVRSAEQSMTMLLQNFIKDYVRGGKTGKSPRFLAQKASRKNWTQTLRAQKATLTQAFFSDAETANEAIAAYEGALLARYTLRQQYLEKLGLTEPPNLPSSFRLLGDEAKIEELKNSLKQKGKKKVDPSNPTTSQNLSLPMETEEERLD